MKTFNPVIIFVLMLLVSSINTSAQIVVTEELPQDTVAVKHPWDNNITFNADPRLAILLEKHKNQVYGGVRHMRGYRVQIYYGIDRNVAMQRKADFVRRYPNIPSYLSYTQPQYRVKVGNFASREDALELYREAINIYGAAMIVPDNVTINYGKND